MTLREVLPEAVARCVDPSAHEELRRAAAQGAIPLPAGQRLSSLLLLLEDPSERVRAEARRAWEELPDALLEAALGDPDLPTPVLDRLAGRASLLWRVLAHPRAGAGALAVAVGSDDEEAVSRAASNQRLLDGHPALARELLANPLVPAVVRGRLQSLYGQEFEAGALVAELPDPAALPDLPADLPPELLEEEPATHREDANLYQLVQTLGVAEKIKLAMLGSKAARRLLIRDPNRIVAAAVMRSPKLREDEVLPIAQDRGVPDEVLRLILARKDWLKSYPVRLALAQNPKTPIPSALRMLETLQERDLRQIAKSRNVQGAVSSAAVRVLHRRGKT